MSYEGITFFNDIRENLIKVMATIVLCITVSTAVCIYTCYYTDKSKLEYPSVIKVKNMLA